jgi:hypothetical protein
VVVWRALWLYMPHISHRVRKLWSQVPTRSRKKNGLVLEVLLLLLLYVGVFRGRINMQKQVSRAIGERYPISHVETWAQI